MTDALTPEETVATMSEIAGNLCAKLAEQLVGKGIPAGLVARAMVATGTAIIEGGEGAPMAASVLSELRTGMVKRQAGGANTH